MAMKRPASGGYKRRLAELELEDEDQPAQSKLASKLITLWSWGHMSAPLVQDLASAAEQDGLNHLHIQKLAKMGGRGKFPANMQRDLMLICGDFTTLGDCTSTISVRVKSLKNEVPYQDIDLNFLLPHKLFSGLYHSLHQSFVTSVLGGSSENTTRFWRQMQKHPFVLARPHLQNPAALSKVVPIALHGDGVNYMQRRAGSKTLDVLSWSSLLSSTGPTKHTNFLMFLVVKAIVKDEGVGQTWPKVWKVLCWSLEALSTGYWPVTNYDGTEFVEGTEDYSKKGQPLAEGYSASLFVLRSDQDFLSNHFHLNNAASNYPCPLCKADRFPDSRPWTDCRATAAWRTSLWSPAQWLAEHPTCHALFSMPGGGLDLVSPDLMHCKHLGTDQVLLGGTLTWLIKHYLPGTNAQNLAMVWEFIQTWYKDLMRGVEAKGVEKERHICLALKPIVFQQPLLQKMRGINEVSG